MRQTRLHCHWWQLSVAIIDKEISYKIDIYFIVKYQDTSFRYIQHYLIQNDNCTSRFFL